MSTRRPLYMLALLAALATLAAGCGGSGSSSGSSSGDSSGSNLGAGIVATVGALKITQARLDQVMKGAEAQYKASKQTFPAAGSPAYKQIQDKAVELLVQRAEFEQKAKSLGISITDKQVADRLQAIIKQPPPNGFGGNLKNYHAALKRQGYTNAQVHEDVRSSLISAALLKKATAGATVTDADVQNYYTLHSEQYSKPQTRVVRHILVKTQAEADRLYRQLKAGASFAALAKKYSQDPGTKNIGGQLTITRGQTVQPFDSTAFALRTGQLSKPVHSQYGWHIIQAVGNAKPRQVTPLSEVSGQIRQLLVQQKRTAAINSFVSRVTKEFCSGKLDFGKGFTPSPDPCATTK